ncbi:MAG TPA: MliC family protein [Pseudomonadales bacterium]|nr:MliC family protein [Pseudomonadales bacterium]
MIPTRDRSRTLVRMVTCCVLLTAVACSTAVPQPQPQRQRAMRTLDAAPPPPSAAATADASPLFAWGCDNDARLLTRYDEASQDLALEIDGERHRLRSRRRASGAAWAGEDLEFWNQGGEAVFTRDGVATRCEVDVVRTEDARAAAAGAVLRALGNEPGWSLEIHPQRMTWVSDYGTRTRVFDAPARAESAAGSAQRWRAGGAAGELEVLVTEASCTDDGGRVFPVSVTLTFEGRSFPGCGRRLEALR